VIYMGSYGLEKPLVESMGIPYYPILTGKLRRYLSWQNVVDLGRIVAGLAMALAVLVKTRPDCIFSKGGFVAVPVAWAAWILRIPVISHESDLTPGLANRLIKPIAKKILYTFPETNRYLPGDSVLVGSPIRSDLLHGDRQAGFKLCGFTDQNRPTLLVMGGSQGALRINQALEIILPKLTERYNIVHLTGKGKALNITLPHYKGFEFLSQELQHIYALCDGVISRAGANSIFELLALRKPMLLIPLEAGSRGDQILNAKSFTERGWALTLREADVTPETLEATIEALVVQSDAIKKAQASYDSQAAVGRVLAEIDSVVRPRP
jgi:UDP-N-acetylglucosamine--N-acetylmuramyl-(pentapeptide) pyrophosphoryl-undecaprenol N-acetylglucosamine transferase